MSAPERGDPDNLRELLRLAQREGALEDDLLPALVAALRERTRLMLAPRDAQLEQARRALAAREEEADWLHRSVQAVERERAEVKEMYERASGAHDRLLEHYRQVLSLAIEAVEQSLSEGYAFGKARRRLEALIATLREERG